MLSLDRAAPIPLAIDGGPPRRLPRLAYRPARPRRSVVEAPARVPAQPSYIHWVLERGRILLRLRRGLHSLSDSVMIVRTGTMVV